MLSSALGNWVHYNFENYRKNGIAMPQHDVKSTDTSLSGGQYYLKNRKVNISNNIESEMKELERILKANTGYQKTKENGEIDPNWQQKMNAVIELLSSEVKNKIQMQNLIEGSGLVKYTGNGTDMFQNAPLSWTEIQYLRSEIKYFSKKIEEIANKQIQASQMKQFVNRYAKFAQTIKKTVTKENGYIPSTISVADVDRMSSTGVFNRILDQYNFIMANTAARGKLGEYVVAACNSAVQEETGKALKEGLEKAVVGSETSTINIPYDSYIGNLKFKGSTPDGGVQAEVSKTQDKVDVRIKVGKSKENLNINVKNYTNPKILSLQKVSLFYPLLKMNEVSNIGTHWLNIHCANSNIGLEDKRESIANNILIQEVAYEALVSGNPFKNDSLESNIFIVMNDATGEVNVFSTADLLSSLDSIKKHFNIIPKVNNIHLDNIYVGDKKSVLDGLRRISTIMSQVHQTNLQVSYKGIFKK